MAIVGGNGSIAIGMAIYLLEYTCTGTVEDSITVPTYRSVLESVATRVWPYCNTRVGNTFILQYYNIAIPVALLLTIGTPARGHTGMAILLGVPIAIILQ